MKAFFLRILIPQIKASARNDMIYMPLAVILPRHSDFKLCLKIPLKKCNRASQKSGGALGSKCLCVQYGVSNPLSHVHGEAKFWRLRKSLAFPCILARVFGCRIRLSASLHFSQELCLVLLIVQRLMLACYRPPPWRLPIGFYRCLVRVIPRLASDGISPSFLLWRELIPSDSFLGRHVWD